MTLTKIDAVSNEIERAMRFNMRTLNPHNLQTNDTVYIKYDKYDIQTNKVYKTLYYICYVSDIINKNIFECIVYDETHKRVKNLDTINILSYKLFKKDGTIPDYASFKKDGSCRFEWRAVRNNGFDNESNIEQYPFFNGAFYVNSQINLFVKRQDPKEETRLQSGKFPNDTVPKPLDVEKQVNYFEEKDISC
jgi:hypothetical protein